MAAVSMTAGVRWQPIDSRDIPTIVRRLKQWSCEPGGAVRHMFPLATIESRGPSVVRVAELEDRWAACIVLPRRLFVPCGDADVIAAAGVPQRRWRLVVGDAAASDALLDRWGNDPRAIVHVQRFQTVDVDAVPDSLSLPDPGLRRARTVDVDGLARLAVQLHLDDGYGPDPGRAGRRAYRDRMQRSVNGGSVWCVGEPGHPIVKIERAVDSARYGVQLSGICVSPDARGKGLGAGAVAAAVRAALDQGRPPISLHVRADNAAALSAYARAGFVDREEWRLAVRP